MDQVRLTLSDESGGGVADLLDALLENAGVSSQPGLTVRGRSARSSAVGSGIDFIVEITVTAATAEALRIAVDVLIERLRGKRRRLRATTRTTKSSKVISETVSVIETEEELAEIVKDN